MALLWASNWSIQSKQMHLTLRLKPFSFRLIETLKTSRGLIEGKKGWLLCLKDSNGQHGWGEVSPIDNYEIGECKKLLQVIRTEFSRQQLEAEIVAWPGSLAFGLGAALAELDGLIGANTEEGWLPAPPSAILLPKNQTL